MLGVTGKLRVADFDYDKFTKTLDKEMGIILRGAVKVWVRTLLHTIRGAPHTVGDTFPIQTGRAKASIRPIARYARVPLPIRPAPGKKDQSATGEQQSEFNVSDDKTRPRSFEYSFHWETHVQHFLENEFKKVSYIKSTHPHGWKATIAARKAADAYIKKEVRQRLKKFKIKHYIQVQRGL
jgi:hypothetical protein